MPNLRDRTIEEIKNNEKIDLKDISEKDLKKIIKTKVKKKNLANDPEKIDYIVKDILNELSRKDKRWFKQGPVLLLIILLLIFGVQLTNDKNIKKNNSKDKDSVVENNNEEINEDNFTPEVTHYEVDFKAEHADVRSFKVSGSTNLPDGSLLQATIYDEDYFDHDGKNSDWRFENLTYFTETIKVRNGEFEKEITGTEMEAPMKSENYKVEISFNPRSQDKDIKKIVGDNGEYIEKSVLTDKNEDLRVLKKVKTISKVKTVPYRIAEERDISYAGCRRVGISIVVPGDSKEANVDYTLSNVIDKNKDQWDDITVWAYKYSEESQIGTIPYSMGMKEYSTCR